MNSLVLTVIEFVVPLVLAAVVLSLTYGPFWKLLFDFTGKKEVAKLFTRIFVVTTLLASAICPLASRPCGIEQLLNYIGISLLVVLVTVLVNLFVMCKLVSALSRRHRHGA